MLDWLIIGGGIQGCTMASYLLKNKKVQQSKLAIIDPHDKPLQMWLRCTSEIDMPYLRSPSIHHLDPKPFALEKFAKTYRDKKQKLFYNPYDRPSLKLFNTHCERLISEMNIEQSWIKDRVVKLEREGCFWSVSTANGQKLVSKHVVIAIGIGEHPCWPEWATSLKDEGANITHIFEEDRVEIDTSKSLILIGGGITAAHAAIKWGNLIPGKVTLLTRHDFRLHQFDSHPGWLGPKNMREFSKVKCYVKRREIIRESRYRGSMPSELKTKLTKANKEGKINIVLDEVQEALLENGLTKLKLKENTIEAEQIMLATGFHQSPPGMEWLQGTVSKQKLKCGTCGYPIVDPSLQWDQGLYVLGALSELEIGPVARNISGARRGAERIIKSV